VVCFTRLSNASPRGACSIPPTSVCSCCCWCRQVIDFNKRIYAGESDLLREEMSADGDNPDPLAGMWLPGSVPFKPNLMNTVVFLVQTAQVVSVLFVNYKGSPWMKGMLANTPLFLSLFSCIAGVGACAWGVWPSFNALIHLEPFPSDEFRWQVMALVAISVLGTFVWDRLVTAVFAPQIFGAMWSEAKQTKPADLVPVLRTALKVGVVVGFLFMLGMNQEQEQLPIVKTNAHRRTGL
jgi:hypothetical protein